MKIHSRFRLLVSQLATAALLLSLALPLQAHEHKKVKPLKALLITGGCCHAYATQKEILKQGIEARAHVIVDQIHTDDDTTNPPQRLLLAFSYL